MGFIYCSSCGHQVSDQESKCPNCGANVSLNPNPNPNPNSNPNPYPNQMQNNWQQPYQQQPYQQPNNTNKLLYVIIGLLAALLLGGLAYFLFSQNSEKEEAINELKQQQELLEQKNEELQSKVDEAQAQTDKANAQAAEAKKEQAQQTMAPNPVSGYYFYGSIGGDDGAYLTMPSGNSMGTYKFINYTRNIKFTSYNPNTGALIISAYEQGTGKYIGKFVGTLIRSKYGNKYTGVFTNYKGGKVNFNLEDIND